ncbi:MAG: response regulator [Phycisphaeraceae bacterium]|nr:response regulator [Phycisphaerae bacterium]MBX3392272.1 response regulator [Phycisphaeraceae bacterium]HRJ49118.1 ATP-binding protein [Phycisphaerales bacterium]
MRTDVRKPISLSLLAVVLLGLPLLAARVVTSRVEAIEAAAVNDAVTAAHARVRSAFMAQAEELSRTVEDWSAWDAMHAFALDPTDDQWKAENMSSDSAASLGLSRIALLDRNARRVVHVDYCHTLGEAADFDFGPEEHRLVAGMNADTSLDIARTGLARGPDGSISWACAKPIRRSDKTGPIAGFLVMVRPMTGEILNRMSAISGTSLSLAMSAEHTGTGAPHSVTRRSDMPLESWDGMTLGNLVVEIRVDPQIAQSREIGHLLLESGIVAYVLLVASSLLAFSIIWTSRVEREPSRELSGRLPVLVAAAVGLSLTAAATWGAMAWQQHAREREFSRRTGNYTEHIDREFAARRDAVRFVQAHFHSSVVVEPGEFDRFIENTGLNTAGSRLWVWVPRQDPRPGESTQGLEAGASEFHSRIAPPTTMMVTPASMADAMRALLDRWPGFEAASLQARDSGRIVTNTFPRDDAITQSRRAVALVAPVYRTSIPSLLEHRRRDFLGSIVSVIELDSVIDAAGWQMDYGGIDPALATVSDRPSIPVPLDEVVDGALTRRCSISIADGLVADIVFTASAKFTDPAGTAVTLGAAASGLVLTGLLVAFMELGLSRTRHVERLVALRTAELRQLARELTEANQDAQAAHQAKSAFLANMSHELRTPMTAILGYADLIAENSHSAETRNDFARIIRRSGEHLLALINDVLDISKIEAGRMAVELLRCRTMPLIDDTLSILRAKADSKGIFLACEIVGEIPETIRTDPTRFRQILVNLVGNAIKFTESGGVRVIVRLASPPDDPDPSLSVEVADTGPGIEDHVMARLFKPFEQGDGSTTRRFGGTGLGLSISRQLANLLGGDITAASTPGEGSSFLVTIRTGPLDGVPRLTGERTGQGQDSLQQDDAGTATKTVDTPSLPDDARILLADDTIDNQRLLAFHLRLIAREVLIVSDGQEAVDAVLLAGEQDKPYDLILMDMQMPRLDGYAATRLLRSRGYQRPIIALTAHTSAEDERRCREAGCDAFLSKPVEKNELARVCARFIDQARRDQARGLDRPRAAA